MRRARAAPTASSTTTGVPRSARKAARPRQHRALSRVLEPRVHAVQPAPRRVVGRPAEQERRHRRGLRAQSGAVAGRGRRCSRPTRSAPLVDVAQQLTGARYGADESSDVSLRIMADHARTVSFLVSDGVFPSNEGRGYVLRRLIRRAVRHAYRLGVEQLVTPELVDTTIELMGEAYPDLARTRRSFATSSCARRNGSVRR